MVTPEPNEPDLENRAADGPGEEITNRQIIDALQALSRQQAETNRQLTEQGRQQAETNRQLAEQGRQQAETNREFVERFDKVDERLAKMDVHLWAICGERTRRAWLGTMLA